MTIVAQQPSYSDPVENINHNNDLRSVRAARSRRSRSGDRVVSLAWCKWHPQRAPHHDTARKWTRPAHRKAKRARGGTGEFSRDPCCWFTPIVVVNYFVQRFTSCSPNNGGGGGARRRRSMQAHFSVLDVMSDVRLKSKTMAVHTKCTHFE